jgi:rhodanese-related sulfurtransferase
MRNLYQFLGIAALTVIAAILTWSIKGKPYDQIVCDPATIALDEVCLNTVISEWHNDVVWVDARRKQDWQKDGIKGSVHITNLASENFDRLMEEALPQLAQAKRAVVYCDDLSCGTSAEVAKRIREFQLVPEVKFLHGGRKALSSSKVVIFH